jgi:hypothetical protein
MYQGGTAGMLATAAPSQGNVILTRHTMHAAADDDDLPSAVCAGLYCQHLLHCQNLAADMHQDKQLTHLYAAKASEKPPPKHQGKPL